MESILQKGRTVWRLAHADRVAFLVDGESYYRAVAHALARARHSIFLLGWDAHSKIELLRGDEQDDLPAALGARLDAVLARNPQLQVHVLDWDYPVFFAQERESRTRLLTQWPASRRFHLRYDSYCPVGASHHQKLVLIDDGVVFGGGMDIGLGRWDTSAHLASDHRRNDPGFADYNPAHDVMLIADDAVARDIGELVRERWRRATGEDAPPPSPASRRDCWPDTVVPDVTDVDVGISRTQPAFEDQPAVVEVEELYLAAISAAQRRIYIENQYLTSDIVVGALARTLEKEDGPEIVIALPQNNFGWFEARTIQVLHFRWLRYLRQMDRHDRLRVCYPAIPGLGGKQVNLHSKVLIVDDRLLRIGSSNLTNRSMRLDTECDFSIDAIEDDRVRDAIAAFRDRLLAEHLCMTTAQVAAATRDGSSLVALVDSRTQAERCLRNVEPEPDQLLGDIGDGSLVDPKGPITAEAVIESFAPPVVRRRAKSGLVRVLAMLVVFSTLAACWRWTPLQQWVDPASLALLDAGFRESAVAPLAVLVVYLVASLLVLPVTVLIIATAAVFGPWLGIGYSLAGSVTSALLMFAIGRVAGRGTVENFTGRYFRQVADGLRNRGLLTMIAIRLLPIAPFTIVNMVVGASGIRARDFALGTVVGMTPGIVGLSLFQMQLERSVREPGIASFAMLALVSLVMIGSISWLRRHLRVAPHAGA